MRLDRLIGIITELQQKKRVTAPYLADKFEVSRRTINRDIEDICKAGIPIVTTQGSGGGIAIMDGFTRDTSKIGHYATGDVEITIHSKLDFEKAKPMIDRAYNEN
jgi:transcriptional antiterminator